MPEELEEVLNAEESNNTGGDKNIPTIPEQTPRKRYSSTYGSYKDPDESSKDEEPDQRSRKKKKKEPDSDPSDSGDDDITDNEDEDIPDEEEDYEEYDTGGNVLDNDHA